MTEPTKPETDESLLTAVERLITTIPGAEPVWELIRRYEALREKPQSQAEADEAEMLQHAEVIATQLNNQSIAGVWSLRDEKRRQAIALRQLLSRYKSQQEQIAELKTQLQTLRDRYDLDDNNLPMNGN